MDENRSLLAIQRHQSRKIQQRESMKSDWPQRLQSLENEVRIYREKLRKVRQRDLKFAETRKWQDGQIVGLKKQVKKLQAKLGIVGGGKKGGKNKKKNKNNNTLPGIDSTASSKYSSSSYDSNERSRELETLLLARDDEIKKVKNQLSMIQRTRDKERIRAEKALKQQTNTNDLLQNDLDEQQIDLERKEKLVKLQIFEVKRLKRQLKDLVNSSKPIHLPNEHPMINPTRPTKSLTSKKLKQKRGRPTPHLSSKSKTSKGGILNEAEVDANDELVQRDGWVGLDDGQAATRVQTSYRGMKSRRKVTKLKQEKQDMHHGASKLQSQYRGRSTRRRVKEEKTQMNAAASTMQSNFRGYKTRKHISATKDQRERDLALQRQIKYQTELKVSAAEKKRKEKEKEARQVKRNNISEGGSTFVTQHDVVNDVSKEEEDEEQNSRAEKTMADNLQKIDNELESEIVPDTKLETKVMKKMASNGENVEGVGYIMTQDPITSKKNEEVDDDDDDNYDDDDDMEWDDEDIAAALEGGGKNTMAKDEKKTAETPKEDESIPPEPVVAQPPKESKFGPGRKKKKKKYY